RDHRRWRLGVRLGRPVVRPRVEPDAGPPHRPVSCARGHGGERTGRCRGRARDHTDFPRAARCHRRRRRDTRGGTARREDPGHPPRARGPRAADAGVCGRHGGAPPLGPVHHERRDRREPADGNGSPRHLGGRRRHDVSRQAQAHCDRIRRGLHGGEPGRALAVSREKSEPGPLVEPRHLRAEGRLRPSWVVVSAIAVGLGWPTAARTQNLVCGPGDVEVASLRFTGNVTFPDAVLEAGIVTTPSSWGRRYFSIVGKRRCLDREQFALDVLRLRLFYHNRGYLAAAVDTIVTPLGDDRVAITFTVREGVPVRVSDLVISGTDSLPDATELVQGIAVVRGGPFDKYAIEETRDTLVRRLRNAGYPDAEVFVGYDTHNASRTATVRFAVQPGRRVHLGPVRVVVTPRRGAARGITDAAVLRVAGIADGDLYSEERLERAKRRLYQTEAYDRVAVVADSVGSPGDPSRRGVTLELTEGYMNVARAAAGYGTLDCFRATGDVTKYNMFDGAARLDLHARVSKLGIGAPFTGATDLCPQARSDPYSQDLNYYVGASAGRPAIFRDFAPSLTVYSERRSEYKSYLRTTPVGGALAL